MSDPIGSQERAAKPVTISSPASGGNFDGNSNGTYSPADGSSVTVYFWRYGPPSGQADRQGAATLDSGTLTWTSSLDVSGLTTTTGSLQAINTVSGVAKPPAEVDNLTVS